MNDEKWRPANAPELKKDFDKSRNQTNEARDDDRISPAQKEYQKFSENRAHILVDERGKERPIARKSKLEELLAERQTPTRTLDLTLGGMTEKNVHQDISRDRENKIKQLVEQLAPRQNQARDNFNINADDYTAKKTKAMQEFEKDWDRDR